LIASDAGAPEVFVIGGADGDGFTDVVSVYAPAEDTWRRAADLPLALHHANAAAVGGRIVVAGFLTGSGFDSDGRVFVYDPVDDSWTSRAPMPAGTERGGSGTAVVDGAVYVFGGIRGGSVATSSRYDLDTDTWEALPDLPNAVDHLIAGTIDGVIYIVGGRTDGLANHTVDLFAYDPLAQSYEARASMPTSRAGAAGAVLDGQLYVFGGEGNGFIGSGVFAQAERYDPVVDAWETLVDMRTPRHGMGAATVDGAIYVPGGAPTAGFDAVATHERFVPTR